MGIRRTHVILLFGWRILMMFFRQFRGFSVILHLRSGHRWQTLPAIYIVCMMKRLGNIILSVFLSTMIVYLVGGVAIVRCCHTEMSGWDVSLEADGCEDGCPENPNCISVTVVKLTPYTKSFVHDSSVVPNIVCAVIEWRLADCLGIIGLAGFQHGRIMEKASLSPRAYLRLIKVLLI